MLMNSMSNSRRQVLRAGLAAAGAGILQACGSSTTTVPKVTSTTQPNTAKTGDNLLRVFASSGYGESSSRSDLGLQRLYNAGFVVTNQQACFRRYQRFAGSDLERIADLQDVASGRVATPKVLMGFRGGYGAMRLLPHIDWVNLGNRMREKGTLLYGFSDVTAIQLALLAKSGVPSFAGPMLYSEFAKPQPSTYTLQSFVDNSTNPNMMVSVSDIQSREVSADGLFWGGNLSVLSALAGSPYMPNIDGGILFLEDVGEQPYRIERMLQTLYLAGVLGRQKAIVLGNFRMGSVRDVYDASYTLNSVIQTVSRVAKVPVLTGFPFGHITNKTTFPLGAHAQLRPSSNGGYQVRFSDYPVLSANGLNLNTLLPQPAFLDSGLGDRAPVGSDAISDDSGDAE